MDYIPFILLILAFIAILIYFVAVCHEPESDKPEPIKTRSLNDILIAKGKKPIEGEIFNRQFADEELTEWDINE